MKFCSDKFCDQSNPQPLDCFYKSKSRHKAGVGSRCKKCVLRRAAESRKKTGYKPSKEQNKRSALKQNYGITLERYNQMFADQNGNCAICGRNQSEFKYQLAVDHCHRTGKVRGLLCGPCNTGIGNLQDRPEVLKNALSYLTNY